MQLSNTPFDRDQSHDPVSNSTRLSRNKINLVELHDKKATFVEDNTTFDCFFNRRACEETRQMDVCNEVSAER